MAVEILPSTIIGGYTPVCSECGIALCWDISEQEYEDEQEFWDAWKCSACNPEAEGSRKRWKKEQKSITSAV